MREQLVDDIAWKDTGCESYPKCLECPLPICKYEIQGGIRAARNLTRDSHWRQLVRQGTSRTAIAVEYDVSYKTVLRATEGVMYVKLKPHRNPSAEHGPSLRGVADEYGVTVQDIISQSRKKGHVRARMAAAKVLRDKGLKLQAIGKVLGNRDHSTILHSLKRAEEMGL